MPVRGRDLASSFGQDDLFNRLNSSASLPCCVDLREFIRTLEEDVPTGCDAIKTGLSNTTLEILCRGKREGDYSSPIYALCDETDSRYDFTQRQKSSQSVFSTLTALDAWMLIREQCAVCCWDGSRHRDLLRIPSALRDISLLRLLSIFQRNRDSKECSNQRDSTGIDSRRRDFRSLGSSHRSC